MASPSEPSPTLPTFLERVTEPSGIRPARRRPWKVVGAVIVVAIVLIAVIFLAGIIPHQSGTTTTPTFSTAQAAADSAARGYGGTGWNSIGAVAVVPNTPLTLTASEVETVLGAASCNVTWAQGAPSTILVPRTLNATQTGGSASWFFLYSDQVRTLLLVVVTNDSGEALFTASGGNCTLAAQFIQPLSHTGVVDSSAAVSTANEKGGATFLVSHPGANRTWAVTGAVTVLGEPRWYVVYSTCPLPPPTNATVIAPIFNSTIDAQTGTALAWQNASAVCSLSLALPLMHPPPARGLGSTGVGPAGAGRNPAPTLA